MTTLDLSPVRYVGNKCRSGPNHSAGTRVRYALSEICRQNRYILCVQDNCLLRYFGNSYNKKATPAFKKTFF